MTLEAGRFTVLKRRVAGCGAACVLAMAGCSGSDDGDGAAAPTGCDPGTQDNDGDGTCSPDCASLGCVGGTCDDGSGTAACTCDTGATGTLCDECDTGFQDNDDDGTSRRTAQPQPSDA